MKTSLKFYRVAVLALLLADSFGFRAGAAFIPASYTNLATADAFLTPGTNGSLSGNNFGAAGALAVAAPNLSEGEYQTVLRFNFAATAASFNSQFGAGQWSILSIMLQLTAGPHSNPMFNTPNAGAFNISLMQNDSWVEGTGTGGTPTTTGVSFNSLPTITSPTDVPLGQFVYDGSTSGPSIFTLALTPQLIADAQAGSDVDFRLSAADNSVAFLFGSREGSQPPVLTVNVIPEPGTMALGALGLATLSALRLTRRVRR